METPFYIRLADLTVEMHNRYPFVRELCRDYTIPAPDTGADIRATVSDKALQTEMRHASSAVEPPYAEGLCLYRSIAEQLPAFRRMVFHGAAMRSVKA